MKRLSNQLLALAAALSFAISAFAAFAASDVSQHAPTRSITLNVDAAEQIPASAGTLFESLEPDIATVDEDGVVTGHTVGFGQVCAKGNGEHVDYQIVVRAGDDTPVYNTRELVAQAVSRGARALSDKITFRVSLTGLPESIESRQRAVTEFLPQEDEIDAAFTRQVYFSMLMDRGAGAVIADVTAQFRYGEGVNVLKDIRGEDVELTERQLALRDAIADAVEELELDGDIPAWRKALRAHDFLALNGRYDEAAAADGTVNPDAFDAYGIMVDGVGVCQAYSEAFLLLMEAAGVRCEYVTGQAAGMPHSWNRVMLDDGMWYNVDCTFDDPAPDRPGYVIHSHFAVTDSALRATHSWQESAYTCEATRYSYGNIKKLLGGKAA